ncbi:MAG: hypothetical protein SFW67_30515 [Myxococcaceae bacterium]|nr:hypothetical protein [Myxococcaceae bacterium]
MRTSPPMSGPFDKLKKRLKRPPSAGNDVLTWLEGRLKDPFVSLEALPRYLAARRDDGSVYLYGRLLTRAEADEITAALPSLLGESPAGLEATLLAGDDAAAKRALESATDDALVGLLHNPTLEVRTAAASQLEARVKADDDARLTERLGALRRGLSEALEVTTDAERNDLERLVRAGLAPRRRGAVRVEAIGCLLRITPDARGEFLEAPLDEKLAAIEALAGVPAVMDFLLDDDDAVSTKARGQLADLDPDAVLAHALEALRQGSTDQRLAALAAMEPLLASRWRQLFDPLVTLTTTSRGALRQAAADTLGRLAKGRRLSRQYLERAVQALEPVADTRETVAALRGLMSGQTSGGTDPLRVIELQLEAGGTDETWAVYGDALLAAGDVRGELVATAGNPKTFKAALKRHQQALFGPLADLLAEDLAQLLEHVTWRHGFIEHAFVDGFDDLSLEEVLDGLLGAPVARFLSKLDLGLSDPMGHDNDFAPAIERLGDSGGAHLLRSLWLGRFEEEQAQMSWAPWGDVSALWQTCPGLVELRLRGASGPLGSIEAPTLESFIVETGGLSRDACSAIAAAELPAVRHLEVWFGDDNYGGECTASDAEQLLARSDRHLKSLGLKNAPFTHELIPLLAAWKPLRQLEVLDLSLGVLTDEDVDTLLKRREAFAHLRRLDLRGNVLDARVKALKKALPNAVLDDQRDTDGERYVAVGE